MRTLSSTCGCGKHDGFAPPAGGDDLCGNGCERDQGVRGGDEDVLLLVVGIEVTVMWIAQVVHRVDEWFVVHLQFLHDLAEDVGADGIEAEVHVEEIDSMVVVGDPARLGHQRRPPSIRDLPAVTHREFRGLPTGPTSFHTRIPFQINPCTAMVFELELFRLGVVPSRSGAIPAACGTPFPAAVADEEQDAARPPAGTELLAHRTAEEHDRIGGNRAQRRIDGPPAAALERVGGGLFHQLLPARIR